MPHAYDIDERASHYVTRAKTIAREIVARHAAEVDREGRFPRESMKALAEGGLFGLCIPEENGGAGQGPTAFAAVVEELAKACGSTAMVYVMHVTAAQVVVSSTTFAGRDELLRSMANGEHLTTLAFAEKGSRSQFWSPVSKLVEAPGGFVTSAYKSWVTSANNADSYVSSGQAPGAATPMESTLYLVRRGQRGTRVDGQFDGLGLRGNDSAPVAYEDLRIADGELLTEQGKGAAGMLEVVLPWFSIGTAAMSVGLCAAAVSATATHLAGTGFEHTHSALRDLPTLRARVAEMHVRTEEARALLGLALRHLAAPSETTPLYVLTTRLSSLKAASEVTDGAMKACGGAAFSKHLGIERIFRDARAGWVMAPTVDHLNDFIGRALTGLPLF